MTTQEKKAMKATVAYLSRVGYEIIDEDYKGYIIAQDENDVVFIKVGWSTEDFGDDFKISHYEFEDAMIKWFMQEREPVDVNVRFDTIGLYVLGKDRALVRHHVNAELEM